MLSMLAKLLKALNSESAPGQIALAFRSDRRTDSHVYPAQCHYFAAGICVAY